MKILVYAELIEEQMNEFIRQLPQESEVILKQGLSSAELKQAINSVDILIGNPPMALFGDSQPALKFWQLENVGFEQYKGMECKAVVANVGDMSAAPCAETIVAGVLGFYRGVHLMVRNQVKRRWQGQEIWNELSILGEKQVIILGAGAIAEHVQKLLKAFGCRVQMTAKSDPDAEIHSYQKLLRKLPHTDLVINTLPGNLDKYVSAEFFDAIKPGALYASVGRGNTTDEAALIKALEGGKLSGAVLDVTENEPIPLNRKLWKMQNVILTQHTGAAHKERDRDQVKKFVENVNLFLKGSKIKDEVNLSDGY